MDEKFAILKTKKIMITSCDNSVGHRIIQLLSEAGVEKENIVALSAKRKSIGYGLSTIECISYNMIDNLDVDVIINTNSKEWVKFNLNRLWSENRVIIDTSHAFQLNADSLLIVPEINADIINESDKLNNILVSPYSVSIVLSLILHYLEIDSDYITVTTYQSVLTDGDNAVIGLLDEMKESFMDPSFPAMHFDKQIAFNIIPQIGEISHDKHTEHEKAIELQTNKILNKTLPLSIMCAYTPITTSDSMVIHIKCNIDPIFIESQLTRCSSIVCTSQDRYMTPLNVKYENAVYVGRIKRTANGVSMWVCWDSLNKGGALNALQIAEEFLRRSVH